VIRAFFGLGQARRRGYARPVRALRNVAAVAVAVVAIVAGTALGVASAGGSARGDSAQGQYGTKPDCNPYAAKRLKQRGESGKLCPETYSRLPRH
jgi:hypothetical protein